MGGLIDVETTTARYLYRTILFFVLIVVFAYTFHAFYDFRLESEMMLTILCSFAITWICDSLFDDIYCIDGGSDIAKKKPK